MRSAEEIQRKISDLRPLAYGTAGPLTDRVRHQLHALAWVLGENDDEELDWFKYAAQKLGPECHSLFPALFPEDT